MADTSEDRGGEGVAPSLWREIEKTTPGKPVFDAVSRRGVSPVFYVPEWTSEEHIAKLQAILRWRLGAGAVRVCNTMDDVNPPFQGVSILRGKAVSPDYDSEGNHIYGRVKSDDALAQMMYEVRSSLINDSVLIRLANLKSEVQGKRGDYDASRKARSFWLKLFTAESYLPVSDPVYMVEMMNRLLAQSNAEAADVGTQLLIEHVRQAINTRQRKSVMRIICKAIGTRDCVFDIDKKKGITAPGAKALDRAYLGRYERGPSRLKGFETVAVDSLFVRTIAASEVISGVTLETRQRVLEMLREAF